MQISQSGIDLIKGFEGVRLKAYKDSAGVWTIGIGHTEDVRPTMVASMGQVMAWFRADIKWSEDAVNKYVKVPLSQNQFDALVSFTFNVGVGAFKKSTLLRMLNVGDYEGASNQFPRWTRAGTEHPPGLVHRRDAERRRFNGEFAVDQENSNVQAADPDLPDLHHMPLVREGDEGPAVEFLRLFYSMSGYCEPDEVGFGDPFGTKLTKITKKFQNSNDLAEDGIVGRNTWQHIASELLD